MKRAVAAAGLACLAGCASAPETIAARPADDIALIGQSCTQLATQRAGVTASLERAEASQRRTRRFDEAGLLLVLLPVGTIVGGNHAHEIGALKGQQEALDEISGRQHCNAPHAASLATP